jgi:type IV secretory pathway TraG/TraD family ATPase VirD4
MIETLIASSLLVGGRWVRREWVPRRRIIRETPSHLVEALHALPRDDSGVVLDPRAALVRPGQTILGDDLSTGEPVQAREGVHTLVIGPPHSAEVGKTSGIVLRNGLEHVGSMWVTSTKQDILRIRKRRLRVGDVWVANPLGLHIDPDLLRGTRPLDWSPIPGSRDPNVSRRYASALTQDAGKGMENAGHWGQMAGSLLDLLLHAAGLGEVPASRLWAWVLAAKLDEADAILSRDGSEFAMAALEGWRQLRAKKDGNAYGTSFSTVQSSLAAFMTPDVMARMDQAGTCGFDAEEFLGDQHTVCVISPTGQVGSNIAPLVVGMTEEMLQATQTVSARNGDKLPVPCGCYLDEVATMCPLSEDVLMGILGQGGDRRLHMVAVLQDMSQAEMRWGEPFADYLWAVCAKVLLPGITNDKTLGRASTLCGESWVEHRAETRTYEQTSRLRAAVGLHRFGDVTVGEQVSAGMEPNMPKDRITRLETGTALVLRDNRPYQIVSLRRADQIPRCAALLGLDEPQDAVEIEDGAYDEDGVLELPGDEREEEAPAAVADVLEFPQERVAG